MIIPNIPEYKQKISNGESSLRKSVIVVVIELSPIIGEPDEKDQSADYE
jgi:hypothetical protein